MEESLKSLCKRSFAEISDQKNNMMNLKGTILQVENAEKRRMAFLSQWQKRLSDIKEFEHATEKHSATVYEAIEYLSQIENAQYWLKIPTGKINSPRNEIAEMDTRLYDFMIQAQMDWLELNNIQPHFLTSQK